MRRSFILLTLASFVYFGAQSQYKTPPNFSTQEEIATSTIPNGSSSLGITDPPDFDVRPMAEWEEIQSLIITWAGFNSINKNIARQDRKSVCRERV